MLHGISTAARWALPWWSCWSSSRSSAFSWHCCCRPIQAAREAARRASCTNNIKNIALAAINYHDQHKHFPVDEDYSEYHAAGGRLADRRPAECRQRPAAGRHES